MTKLVVVEARRLLPVAVLFLMLVAVSVYDGLASRAKPVTTLPNSVPYKTLVQTALSGEVRSSVVTDLDTWVVMHNALGLKLSDYDFNPKTEIAVFLANCQLLATREVQGVVELTIVPDKNNFQVVLFDKTHLSSKEDPQFVLVEASGRK